MVDSERSSPPGGRAAKLNVELFYFFDIAEKTVVTLQGKNLINISSLL